MRKGKHTENRESRRERRRRKGQEASEESWEGDRPEGIEARQVYPPPPEQPQAVPGEPAPPTGMPIAPPAGGETVPPPQYQQGPVLPQGPAGAYPPAPQPMQPPYATPSAPVVHEQAPPGEAPPGTPAGYPPPGQPPPDAYGQGYWTPYGWYQPPYPPPGYGYPPAYPPPPPPEPAYGYGPGRTFPPSPDQTGQMPVVPFGPLPPPGFPMQPEVMPPIPPTGVPVIPPFEEQEFTELTKDETPFWRIDLKWVFGFVMALFLLIALTLAGLYRVTGPGAASHILVPVIQKSTNVENAVRDNYQQLKRLARRRGNAEISIPDIGVDITLNGNTIKSLSADALTERVIGDVEKKIYSQGYKGNLPMKYAAGVGEERGKAVSATYLALLNKKTHGGMVWPLVASAGIALAFTIIFLIFCRRWGKATGIGLAIIAASLPGSLIIRIGTGFFWDVNAAGVFRGSMYQALRSTGAMMSAYYDIALAFGALLLLVGVVGGLVARRASHRVPPFLELKRPEESVVGGPSIEMTDAGPLPPPPPPPEEELGKEPAAGAG